MRPKQQLQGESPVQQAAPCVTPAAEKPAGEFKTSRERREYLREYYRKHRAKQLQYQREYNLRHKKKSVCAHVTPINGRATLRSSLHAGDIMHAAPERAARLIDQIVRGDRALVASSRAESGFGQIG